MLDTSPCVGWVADARTPLFPDGLATQITRRFPPHVFGSRQRTKQSQSETQHHQHRLPLVRYAIEQDLKLRELG